jgi:GntR family transcriptional regulator/MocR family aminotransferase
MWQELEGEGPLQQRTYRALRRAILEGRLAPGSRLGSSRALAAELGVSRNTVLGAFAQLLSEGYVTARAGSGTYVARRLPEEALQARRAPAAPSDGAGASPRPPGRPSAWIRRLEQALPQGGLSWSLRSERLPYDFRYGEPAYRDLPIEAWSRALGQRLRRASIRRLAYSPPGGAPELRQALAAYLARSRGVECDAEQIVVTYGAQQAIDLVARVVVDPGARVAVEEPGYTGISVALRAAGARLVPIGVDLDGMQVERLARLAPARLVCVTPSHQFPTGAILPLARRLALLAYAGARDALVFEDDYDSEFRYDGRPIESLQGLDRAGRVLYAGTASKLLFPALRIGWLVLPPSLVPRFRLAKAASDTGSATLEQLALADAIDSGQLDRHVRRARLRNAARREALLAALARFLGDAARVDGPQSGLHVVVWLPATPASRVSAIRRRAAARGAGVYPVAPYYQRPPAEAGFVLGYAALSEEEIREGIRRFAEAVEEVT